MYRLLLILAFCLLQTSLFAQKHIVSGPMLGYTEYRSSKVWVEVSKEVEKIYIVWWATQDPTAQTNAIKYDGLLHQNNNTITFQLANLKPNTHYSYQIITQIDNDRKAKTGVFSTLQQTNYNTPKDFNFITGSCAYFNQPLYDNTDQPYGGDSSIFLTMGNTTADFMLWLGDNWYYRPVDYFSKSGLWYRAQYVRSQPVMQELLKKMPQYAIWDDHDFGPNNSGSSYIYKPESRNVFKSYWANPSYGEHEEGIYTQLVYSDVSFFLLDDRTWRSADNMLDSINHKPNPEKEMFGKTQLQWLKNALLQNQYAPFKIIVTGSQMLNTYSPYDCFYHYPKEFQELMTFIDRHHIEGVLFLTGDRHRSEIIKMERENAYTLYDITVSPLTSKTYKAGGKEKDIPTRVLKIESKQNFANISVNGTKGDRTLHIDYIGLRGDKLAAWEINEQELKN